MQVANGARVGDDQTVTIDVLTTTRSAHAAHGAGRPGWLSFGLHYVEMLVVMFAGMGILGLVLGMPHDASLEVQALWMTATMTVPMVAWMLFRGHTRRASVEMGAAMIVPVLALLPALWAGLLSADALFDLMHLAMLPTMLGAMLLRRSEYGL